MALLAAAAALVPALSACGSPHYRFVTGTNDDLVVRVPAGWTPISAAAVRKASGQTGTDAGWLTYFDAAAAPSVKHVNADSTSAPVLRIQSVDLSSDARAGLTDDELRDLFLPITDSARGQLLVSLKAAGRPVPKFEMFRNLVLNTRTEHGVRVTFGYDFGSGEEVFDQVVVTDPKKTRVHILLVHCSRSCFDSRRAEITAVADSLTVKKPR